MNFDSSLTLAGQYAIVTGSARGIGAEIACAFARAGATVALLDCNKTGLLETAEKIKAIGQTALCLEIDLRDTVAIEQTVKKLFNYNPVWNILVNNAATVIRAPLVDFKIEDWDLMMQVNLRAVFVLSRLMAKKMIEQRAGKIINISSNATFYGTPESGPYAASKAAINQLTKTMTIEWGPHNIQINAICPGLTNTPLLQKVWMNPENTARLQKFIDKIPLGRLLEPNEISPLVLFLAGPTSNYINGAMFQIDNGARYNPD